MVICIDTQITFRFFYLHRCCCWNCRVFLGIFLSFNASMRLSSLFAVGSVGFVICFVLLVSFFFGYVMHLQFRQCLHVVYSIYIRRDSYMDCIASSLLQLYLCCSTTVVYCLSVVYVWRSIYVRFRRITHIALM